MPYRPSEAASSTTSRSTACKPNWQPSTTAGRPTTNSPRTRRPCQRLVEADQAHGCFQPTSLDAPRGTDEARTQGQFLATAATPTSSSTRCTRSCQLSNSFQHATGTSSTAVSSTTAPKPKSEPKSASPKCKSPASSTTSSPNSN